MPQKGETKLKLVVIDGQGGGFGRAIIEALRAKGYTGEVAAAIYPLPFTKKIKGYAVFLPPLFCSINSIIRSNSSSNWNLMVISLFSYT